MNWMTSGRHRALYSQRGRRRQMHFPSQVQRQRVKHSSPPRSSQPPRQDATPWYIVPVGDDDESQDIRVLELERKGAMKTDEAEVEVQKTGLVSSCGDGGGAQSSPSRKRNHGRQEQEYQDGRRRSRCIFTPVKKRKYEQPLPVVQGVEAVCKERPPSSIASGVDMLFFNDGKELQGKNQRQHTARTVADSAPSRKHRSQFSKYIIEKEDQETLQPNYQNEDSRSHSRKSKFQQQSSDSESSSRRDCQALPDKGYDPYQRDFQRWAANSGSCQGSNPDSTLARQDSVSIRGTRIKSHDGSPPSSPFEASPLTFRMSRADVLQSQLSARASRTASDPLESRLSFTPTPQSSQSPSTSASSQGSMVLGRPPLGWQKKMLLSLREDAGDKDNSSIPESTSLPFSAEFAGSKLDIAQNPRSPLDDPLEPLLSPSSSRDSSDSTIGAVVPIDAKDRIMTAVYSQHLSEGSQTWFQRTAMTSTNAIQEASLQLSTNLLNVAMLLEIENDGEDTALCTRNMTQQSWVMSSRTHRILDAVSSAKTLSTENTIANDSAKLQEMESVAVYMYTLVQCYKIDEKFRADTCTPPVVDVLTSPRIADAVTKQITSRRTIAFSPKRAN